MNVKEILSRTPPELLYHYTTQTGLLGIAERKEIWASHTQYLKDQQEFHHAITIVKEELAFMKHRSGNSEEQDYLAEMETAVNSQVQTMNVCVCSFSEDGDLLSQWRAYAGQSGGYSIGFSGNFLRSISDQERFYLVPCLYREDDQRELVRRLLEDVLRENIQRKDSEEEDKEDAPPGGNLLAYLTRYAPILKHRSFSEEREWRIVSRPLMCSNKNFGYRPGISMLIPYYRIPLSSEQRKLQIDEVIVGPSPHSSQSALSVRGLLVREKLKDTRVRPSSTPFRNW